MGKSIRAKCKRANRTEFRNTIGAEWADKQMAITQAKLQECVNKGAMNSFDKLSNLLSTSNNEKEESHDEDNDTIPMDMETQPIPASSTNSSAAGTGGKRSEKVATKKTKRKQWIPNAIGQHGAKLTAEKIAKMKRRGQWKHGQKVTKSNAKPTRRPRRSFI